MRLLIPFVFVFGLFGQSNRIFPTWWYDLSESKPVKWGIRENSYVFDHTVGGVIIARTLNSQTVMGLFNKPAVEPGKVIGFVVYTAITWEGIEYYVEGYEPYGSRERWFWDSFGDIGAATLGAVLTVRYHIKFERIDSEIMINPMMLNNGDYLINIGMNM